jgi:hypothetical protein
MIANLDRVETTQPIHRAIAEFIFERVCARIAAEAEDRSDGATVERLLREEVAHYNAQPNSEFRVILHSSVDEDDGFQIAFDVVRKSQASN